MKRAHDNILFDEYGQPILLSADDLIEYLIQNLHHLRYEKDLLEKQLDEIRLILNPKDQIDSF